MSDVQIIKAKKLAPKHFILLNHPGLFFHFYSVDWSPEGTSRRVLGVEDVGLFALGSGGGFL